VIVPGMVAAARAAYPASSGISIGVNPLEQGHRLQTFVWPGVTWTPAVIAGRLLWFGVALAISLVAALFFTRFDASRERRRRGVGPAVAEADLAPAAPVRDTRCSRPVAGLTPVVARFRIGSLLLAELRVMLKGRSRWWYLIACILVVGTPLVAVLNPALRWVPAVALIWPVLVWSGLGSREAQHGTEQLLLSAARPLWRQLPASWLAGVVVAAASGAGIAALLAINGDAAGLLVWAVGVLFVPSLALSLGTLSRSGKAFEVIYSIWWYAGPVNGLAPLDYSGLSGAGVAVPYMLLTAGLLSLALVSRSRRAA